MRNVSLWIACMNIINVGLLFIGPKWTFFTTFDKLCHFQYFEKEINHWFHSWHVYRTLVCHVACNLWVVGCCRVAPFLHPMKEPPRPSTWSHPHPELPHGFCSQAAGWTLLPTNTNFRLWNICYARYISGRDSSRLFEGNFGGLRSGVMASGIGVQDAGVRGIPPLWRLCSESHINVNVHIDTLSCYS